MQNKHLFRVGRGAGAVKTVGTKTQVLQKKYVIPMGRVAKNAMSIGHSVGESK